MSKSNMQENAVPELKLLDKNQIEHIHRATLDILETTGVLVQHPKARKLLVEAGCIQVGDEVIRFPAEVIAACLGKAPSSVPIFSRDGEPVMNLGGRRSYFGAGGSCPYILDSEGQRRQFIIQDARNIAIITDACRNLSFSMTMCHSSDIPVAVRDICEISETILASPKPLIIASNDESSLADMVEMFRVAAGGHEELTRKPFIIYYTEPISPLMHTTHSLEKLIMAVEAGLPVLNTPAPMAGATGPVTLAGNIVVGNAELLSGLVLVQTLRPGAPFIYGGVFSTLDMASTIMPYGSPELNLQTAAMADMARNYGLPSFGTAGCTDANRIDAQAGFEAGQSILTNILCGANLIHDVGWLEFANTVSSEMIVGCDEMIGWARRFMEGIALDKRSLAADIIKQVGIGGSFTETELTFSRYRSEQWFSAYANRQRYDTWIAQGSRTYQQKLKEQVNAILSDHKPEPMVEEKSQIMKQLVTQACSKRGVIKNPVN